MKRVSAPLRIDLCGGALDIQPIPSEIGPTKIISAAINIRVEGTITNLKEIDDTIDKSLPGGILVGYQLPKIVSGGSGLGSSGVMNLVWLALISDETHPYVLADRVYNIEKAMGVIGGTQDQFTSAFGGLLMLEFNGNRVFVNRITENREFLNTLSKRLYLIDTKITRISSDVSRKFIDGFQKGEGIEVIKGLKKLTNAMFDLLTSRSMSTIGNFDNTRLIDMLDHEWAYRKIIYSENSDLLDNIIGHVKGGFDTNIGIKPLGACAGGCMLAYLPDGIDINSLRKRVEEVKCNLIDIEIDPEGLIIETNKGE